MSFTLGCDPELICRRNGQFVPANNFFKSNSSFGLDGCDQLQKFALDILNHLLTSHQKYIRYLNMVTTNIPDLEFYAGHYVDDHTIGGHTHFSISPEGKIIEALDVVLEVFPTALMIKHNGLKDRKLVTGKSVHIAKRSTDLNIAHQEVSYSHLPLLLFTLHLLNLQL